MVNSEISPNHCTHAVFIASTPTRSLQVTPKRATSRSAAPSKPRNPVAAHADEHRRPARWQSQLHPALPGYARLGMLDINLIYLYSCLYDHPALLCEYHVAYILHFSLDFVEGASLPTPSPNIGTALVQRVRLAAWAFLTPISTWRCSRPGNVGCTE